MKVSIIVPVYEVEKYLDKCISSIVNQTYHNIEIILVDDGGKDHCPEMCDSWAEKDNRIIVIHKENGGQGTARNAALDIMTGDYVLFVDSDDYIDVRMVEKLILPTFTRDYDVVLCSYKMNNGISFRLKNASWYEKCFFMDNLKLIEAYLRHEICTSPWCKLFKSSIFNNIRFPDFRANEDAFIMHRLFGRCKNAYVLNEHLYIWNIRMGSTGHCGFNENRLCLMEVAYDLRKYINEDFPQYLHYVSDEPLKTSIHLLETLYREKKWKRFEDIEKKLVNYLEIECKFLTQCGVVSATVAYGMKVLNEYGRFKHKCICKGKKYRYKQNIKRLLIRIKSGMKININI